MKKPIWIVLFLLPLTVAIACTQAEPTTGAAVRPVTGSPPATDATSSARKPGWEQEWNNIVVEAKKEGNLLIYAGSIGEAGRALTSAFREKYGISADIVAGRGEEIVARIESERKAGIYGVDVGLPGMTWYFSSIDPGNMSVPLQPLLVLPEILDTSKWREGKLPMGDKKGRLAVILMAARSSATVNRDFVKPDEFTTTNQLTEPKWRGKVVMNDPTVGGSGNSVFTFEVAKIMGLEKGTAFMKQLAKQDLAITRDLRLMTEWIARGKYPVGLGADPAPVAEFVRAGAPLAYQSLKEPRWTTTGTCSVFIFDKAPHPNAARLFANWILSKEGSSIFAKTYGYPSIRTDISPEGIDPALIPEPGDVILGEDYELAKQGMMKLAAEIFRDLIK